MDERAVDMSAWDGAAAMSYCAGQDDPAAAYRAICAGRKAGDPAVQSSWALPHHKRPGQPPNAAGVRNSLSRLPQTQGLTNRQEAQRHLEAHMADIQAEQASSQPPRDNLVRMEEGRFVMRQEGDSPLPVMTGHFAVFDQWTEIDSLYEGHFMERIAPGAFKRTLASAMDAKVPAIRVTFNHGRDPSMGDKLLGVPTRLEEDDQGAAYDVPLWDTSYNRDLLPGLEAGAYGASFRFRVLRQEYDKKPKKSDYNPDGIPERTISEAQVMEFGPVSYPAYAGASAGLRSATDLWLASMLEADPERLMAVLEHLRAPDRTPALEHRPAPARPTETTKRLAPTSAALVALLERN